MIPEASVTLRSTLASFFAEEKLQDSNPSERIV